MTAAPLPTFPDALRPHVAQVLRHHYETSPSMITLGGSGISVTGAVIERASMLSMRMATCPTCLGSKTENITLTNKRVVSITCWRCHGDGEIGEIRKTKMQEQTVRCTSCKGTGTVVRPEYRKDKVHDPHPLPCEDCDAHGYRHMDTVICGTGEYPHSQPTPGEELSVATDALRYMREAGQERSLLVLSIAYGEVGRGVERQLDLPVALSLWPHTTHGRKLLDRLGAKGQPPWETLHGCLGGDWTQTTLASMANTSAIALLEMGLSHLARADGETGGSITGAARRLKLAAYWAKEKK
jgi:hypothetical protein